MMVTAAVIGLSAGKKLLTSAVYYSDLTDKISNVNDHGPNRYQIASTRNIIVARKASYYGSSFPSSSQNAESIKALREHVDTASSVSTAVTWFKTSDDLEEESSDFDYSLKALILQQKYMLEKQWNLSFEETVSTDSPCRKSHKKITVTCSGVSARQRRMNAKRKNMSQSKSMVQTGDSWHLSSVIPPELMQNRSTSYVNGVAGKTLLNHAEVMHLSGIIKSGLFLEQHKSRLKKRLGYEPSEEQLATSLRISRAELQSKLIVYSLAREKLMLNNVRLVMSIAQTYDPMGVEMADLVQGGLFGLLRGIEKFDSSRGFKISTYIYWWIRQGVSRALAENSRTVRLPIHLQERLRLIRKAKISLEEKGITPSIDKIAESLKMSPKKVRNATEADVKVFSFDREAFPSLDGRSGETHHSYVADKRPENQPWHGVDESALKDEVHKLINLSLEERERQIIRLYYGLDCECHSWEDISKHLGLSRERVRQVGLVALKKLKEAASTRDMEAMLVKH